ncbi:MAG TPA: HAD-IB family hydrolase [Acidimicrobiales bacterium]|nr:HAD-IB family hydrolase [Acidimicrobiales bacterium]
MERGAAFFDLDRTILRGASGPVINHALAESGLIRGRQLPGQGVLFRVYDLIGETLPSMALTRGAALMARGWSVDAVRKAGEVAAEGMLELVTPYARPLLEDHRAAGRPLVLTTTTPLDLVVPLAEALGFDDVVATRYAAEDGVYTGGLAGEFVWGLGKLAAVRRWAEDHRVDLGASFAYTDSVYDFPLLSRVGHPFAVNPDPRLRALALLRRWPVLFLDVPPGVPKLAGLEPFDLLRQVARPELFPFARFDIGPTDHIPAEGPVIVAANHRSYFDPVALAMAVVGSGRSLRFLGKKEVFDAPVVGPLARAMGGIRVERGSGSDRPLREAARLLSAGEAVAMLPQATIPRGRAFFDPHLTGKTGAARLAAMTGAPVVPVGLWGTERVWPRAERMPRVANVVHPPTVRVRVGPPVRLGLTDAVADTEAIMAAITRQLPAAARRAREPSPEELALAVPSGHSAPADG